MCHTCSAYNDGLICVSAKTLLKYLDGIKEFCSDVVEKVVNFFKGLFSNEEQQDDTETFTEEECKNGVSETEVSDDTECTCDACVICTNATEDSIPIHLKKEGVLIHLHLQY